jgi:hypothetical protein
MNARRRWLVVALVTVMVGGHLYDLVTDREHWPFSQYPMYSHAAEAWSMLIPRLAGVRSDGAGELPLWETRYLAPFDQARLVQALQTMLQEPDGRARVTTALTDCLARYEARRRVGEHDGPALTGLRLYHVLFTLERTAANVDRPDRRDLVLEVTMP